MYKIKTVLMLSLGLTTGVAFSNQLHDALQKEPFDANYFKELVAQATAEELNAQSPRHTSHRTPLILAIRKSLLNQNYVEAVNALLSRDETDVNKCDDDGMQPIVFALLSKKKLCIDALTSRADIDLTAKSTNGHSVFHWAIISHNIELAKDLLNNNLTGDLSQDKTVLHSAIETDDEDLVLQVLERPDVFTNSLDGTGRSPLSIARDKNMANVIDKLNKLNNQ